MDSVEVREKENIVVVLCSRPPENVKLGTFTSLSCIDGKETYKKSVIHVQSCFFANLNLSLFCRSRCRRRRPCLSSLISLFWNFRGLNDLPEMRFEFPLNFIRKLIIKARTQILVHGGRGGGGQDKDFGAVSQTDLTRSLTT